MTTINLDARLAALIAQSERAHAARDTEQSMRLLIEAQKLAPDHAAVLNLAGLRALEAGLAEEASRLLRRAILKDEGNATLWVNLAAAHRQLQRIDEEAGALERALAIDSRHLVALLQKASIAQRKGQGRAAAVIYANALKTIPPGAKLPDALRPGLEAALSAVRANAESLGHQIHAALDANIEGDVPPRVAHALDAFLGKRPIYHPQPTQLHVPMLPALEFYPREHFPWLAALEAATADIQRELNREVIEDQKSFAPYITYPAGVPLDQWRELNHSRRWSALFLWQNGKAIEENVKRCPATVELLRSIPMHDVPGQAPTAFFSMLDAHTHIPAHTGVTNSRVIVHLPLVVPEGCRFRVGSTTRVWRVGEAWVFDDSIEHEAWNDSDVRRAVLIFDVWNPFLDEKERAVIRLAMPAIENYYGSEITNDGGI